MGRVNCWLKDNFYVPIMIKEIYFIRYLYFGVISLLRVLIFSDTHGRLEAALKIIKEEKFDLILHAGDFFRDSQGLAAVVDVPVYGVIGNCDPPGTGPAKDLLTLGGKKILLVHGHQFRVKISYQSIFYRACQEGVDAVVFGHTHVPLNETMEGILLFNPGSASCPQPGHSSTYGILEIDNEAITGHIYNVNT